MSLESKIVSLFDGKVVRKDLSKEIKGNAVVPTYVLEYLLGQHCASSDPEVIQTGVQRVRTIIRNNFVHRDEAELVKATIREKGIFKVIDKVEAQLDEKRDCYVATFSNLGIRNVMIDDQTVKQHEKLLTGGVWCIVDVGYLHDDDRNRSPWIVDRLKPIQISSVDVEEYKALRDQFTTEEWLTLLAHSIGLNPEHISRRGLLLLLLRMVPFCENNYNLIELGPKGTGKSHIFSEFSPHGILISGGDVTQAKLFVNNASGRIGLVGFWDSVAFDEFAGKDKRVDKKLVDIMKNYMANKSFSRGRDVYGASASMAFLGNTDHSVPFMLKHSHLFESLPNGYLDSAFLDRIHAYLPGWEVNKLRGELFSEGYGFIVDYLAEVFKALRKEDFSHLLKDHFDLSASLTSRDRDGITKTFSGLAKLIYPHGRLAKEEVKELLDFSIECRKRVKLQLYKLDDTFEEVDFNYTDQEDGSGHTVETLEQADYRLRVTNKKTASPDSHAVGMASSESASESESGEGSTPQARTLTIREDQTGVSYETLFGEYLIGAKEVTVYDPYIRKPYQINNFFDLLKVIIRNNSEGEEVAVMLYTSANFGEDDWLANRLDQIAENVLDAGIRFSFELENSPNFHARSIETDTGWKITLERGLDIFQAPEKDNPYSLAWSMQEFRRSKGTTIHFLRSVDEQVLD